MSATLAPPSQPKVSPPSQTSPGPSTAGGVIPSTSGSPGVVTDKAPNDYLGDIGTELLEMDSDTPKKESAKRPPSERVRDADGKFTSPPDGSETKEKESGTEHVSGKESEESEKTAEPEKKLGPFATVRKAKEALEKERDTVWRPKVQELESKVQEYERTVTELKKTSPDLKPVQEKMDAIEKENAALREEIRFTNYQKHPEFTEKYQKPYVEAFTKAVSEITQLNIEMEDGTARKATTNDFLALANAPLDQLDDLAGKWFPRSSARVIRHVEKVRDLAEAQEKALADAKKGATEFESRRTLEHQAQDAEIAKAYAETATELGKKYPKWFGTDEADPSGNDLFKKGLEYASTVFENAPANINGQTRPLTPLERVKRLSVIKAKAANHDRLVSRMKVKDARIAELEEELAAYEESGPPTATAGEPGSENGKGFLDTVNDEIRKLDRR